MQYQGTMTKWNEDRGFGFISPNGGGTQVFAHIKSFSDRQRRPVDNDIVTYELKTDADGRSQAVRIAFVDDCTEGFPSIKRSTVVVSLPVLFILFVTGTVLTETLPAVVLALYWIASVWAFLVYAFDKSAAENNRWRTSENTLHILAVIGGWPGALVAQQVLRHKSKKQSFQIVFWITVVANCGALGWLLSPHGLTLLRSLYTELKLP